VSEPFYPGALDLPDRIVGARVVLRPFERADAPALWAAIDESREHLRPWLPWADGHRTVEATRDFAAKQQAGWIGRTDFGCGVFVKVDGRVLGGSGLHVHDWRARHFEIGYWLRLGETGRGYMRETVALLSRFAFDALGAVRVMIRCDSDNDASRRVAEGSGYLFEGCRRRDGLKPDGSHRDTLVFSMLREEYDAALPGWRRFFAD
jgi:RimJ/RimL family protein N-acetyltransferase